MGVGAAAYRADSTALPVGIVASTMARGGRSVMGRLRVRASCGLVQDLNVIRQHVYRLALELSAIGR
jgi:hypothetical protein